MRLMYQWLLLIAAAGSALYQPIQANKAPKVSILKPDVKSISATESILPYKIEVNDPEDGFSGYDEITSSQVFMKVDWINDSRKLAAYEEKQKKDEKLYRLISVHGCMNCHSFRQKLAGPTFEQVTKKYASEKGSVSMLANKIRNGSKGIWGDSQQMPAHPQLSDEEAQSLVKWIFERSAENHFQYIAGIEGSIQFNASLKPKGGFYVFTAWYADHGINGNDTKSGSQTILIPLTN